MFYYKRPQYGSVEWVEGVQPAIHSALIEMCINEIMLLAGRWTGRHYTPHLLIYNVNINIRSGIIRTAPSWRLRSSVIIVVAERSSGIRRIHPSSKFHPSYARGINNIIVLRQVLIRHWAFAFVSRLVGQRVALFSAIARRCVVRHMRTSRNSLVRTMFVWRSSVLYEPGINSVRFRSFQPHLSRNEDDLVRSCIELIVFVFNIAYCIS